MIATRLAGGLGNQMFQYAAGRSLALRHHTELLLDLSFLESAQSGVATRRAFALTSFDLEARVVRGVRSWEPPLPDLGIRGRLASKARRRRSDFTVVHQKGLDFQPAYFTAPDRTLLIGFWQSERYFEEHADVLRTDFRLSRPLPPEAASLLEIIRGSLSVSLHVRRGDYAHDPATRAHHGLLPLDYYRRALEELSRRLEADLRVYVFSDDPDYCRHGLQLDHTLTIVERSWAPEDDLRLMSNCRHHIIANSCFSWWGAWLDPKPEKIVIAPREWVADASVDTAHLIPQDWVRI
jgi:hypothetical protein